MRCSKYIALHHFVKLQSLFDRPNLLHFWHIIFQHILDAVFQCRRRTRASGAGALHMKIDNAIFESFVNNIATVLSNRRTHARINKFADLPDDFTFISVARRGLINRAFHGWSTGLEVFHDSAQN